MLLSSLPLFSSSPLFLSTLPTLFVSCSLLTLVGSFFCLASFEDMFWCAGSTSNVIFNRNTGSVESCFGKARRRSRVSRSFVAEAGAIQSAKDSFLVHFSRYDVVDVASIPTRTILRRRTKSSPSQSAKDTHVSPYQATITHPAVKAVDSASQANQNMQYSGRKT